MARPDISVIIAVYEQPDNLRWLLDALAIQEEAGRVEVLVTDDGSGERIPEIVRNAAIRHRFDVHYLWQPDDGFRLTRARNNALRCAQGDHLVVLDADVLPPPDFLRRHRAAACHPKTLVCGHPRLVFLDDRPAPSTDVRDLLNAWWPISETYRREEALTRMHADEPWLACVGCNFSVTRTPDVWFDEHFVGWGLEDTELAARLARRHGFHVVNDPSLEVLHVDPRSRTGYQSRHLNRSHDATVAFLRNALYFRSLYRDVDLAPLLRLMLGCCYRDPLTDRWHTAPRRPGRRYEEIVQEAEAWFERHSLSIHPAPPRAECHDQT